MRRRPLYTPLAMAIISALALLLLLAWLVASWGSTTVVLVRHAEHAAAGEDPGLTEEGRAHALRLAEMLEKTGISAIYVSQARRTHETVLPTAQAAGLEPRQIAADEVSRLARRLKWRHRGDVVLVVGHSNTVPSIAAALGVKIGVIEAEDYSGLWVISYSRLRGTRLLTLRY